MAEYVCPMCGNSSCTSETVSGGWEYLECMTYNFEFFIGEEIPLMQIEQQFRIYNLIFERILRDPTKAINGHDAKWRFFFDECYQSEEEPNYVNLVKEMKDYPKNVVEKINRALLNISIRYSNIGDNIEWPNNGYEYRMLFCDSKNQREEFRALFKYMKELGYFDGVPFNGIAQISYKGWRKLEELNATQKESNQGFIAMSFSDDAKPIMEVFKRAIVETGYKERVISEKEHNNQIVPEIFFEIGQSKFIVVDVTYPNYGAYYEAGYAQALGKQVIVCCRKQEFDSINAKPHFDIAQKAMIIWTTESELKDKLIRRIQATVK